MRFFKKTIRDVPLEGTTVLLRADFNVPLKDDGTIHDDFRIRASLPTIKRLLKDGCKVVVIAHLGRPEGNDSKLSLEPAALRLAQLLGEPVRFVDRTIGDKVKMAVKRAPKRSVVVLENLRFHPEEEANDEAFARALAVDSGARFFVQDGFGVVHRDHASTAAITLFLPSVAGLLLEKEYQSIMGAMKQPNRPLVAIMGGAKVSDKIQVVDELVAVADKLLIGGAMANTFLAARGHDVGASKHEEDQLDVIKEIYAAIDKKVGKTAEDTFLELPTDATVAKSVDDPANHRIVGINDVAADDRILDIGPDTIETYVNEIRSAGTVIWNGTLGYAELAVFAKGSAAIAEALAGSTADSIIGGGDTADFVIHWDKKKGGSFSHVSTGGGASLELMADGHLPGIDHLLDA